MLIMYSKAFFYVNLKYIYIMGLIVHDIKAYTIKSIKLKNY